MSFRDGPKDQTRNLEIPGSMLAHRPGMTGERFHTATSSATPTTISTIPDSSRADSACLNE
jgi:hypothetical protein